MEKVDVIIECPECGKVQEAVVELTEPWATMVHDCAECKYVIGESEWNEISKRKYERVK